MTTLTTILSISDKGAFTYTPNALTVTAANTELVYQLDSKTADSWEIVGLTSTDSKSQLGPASKTPSGNSISTVDANTNAEVFDITVIAQHRTQRDRLVRIDPQISNVPPK